VANQQHLRRMVENSIGIVTALNPFIGYERATAVAKEAHDTGRSVYELVLEKGWMSKEQLDEVLRPEVLTKPRQLTFSPSGEEGGAP
jgi:aspartate ammonia-lyase